MDRKGFLGFNSFQQPAYRTGRHQVIQPLIVCHHNQDCRILVSIPFNNIKSFNNNVDWSVLDGDMLRFNSFQQPAYRTGRHQVIQHHRIYIPDSDEVYRFNSFQQPAYRTGRHQVIQPCIVSEQPLTASKVSIPFNNPPTGRAGIKSFNY